MTNHFGKGCPFFSAMYDPDEFELDINDKLPILVMCTRSDNPEPDTEGNCNFNQCPLGKR